MDEPVIIFHSPADASEASDRRVAGLLEDTAEHPVREDDDTETAVEALVATPVATGEDAAAPGAPGEEAAPTPLQGAAPPPPPPPPPPYGAHWPYGPGWAYGPSPAAGPPPRRHRPSRALVGAAAAVTAAGLGIGIVVGYAAFSGSSPSATRTSSSSASTPIGAIDPGLVNIDTVLGYQTAGAAGTGMVLSSTGIVLTNNHVVEGATSIKATDVGNGQTYNATVLGYDTSADVAVIKLTGASGLSTVTLGSSSSVAAGQSVIALGNAGGAGGTPKVARGTVTALDQAITASDQGSGRVEHLTGMIQTNAPIQPGDSGGPLVNTSGQVVGMDTAGSSSSGQASTSFGTATGATVQAFSIPINTALTVAHQIENGSASSTVHIGQTAFLGVQVSSTSPAGGARTGTGASSRTTGAGVPVAGVVSGSPAASAGLSAGDVITSVDGHTVSSTTDLTSVMDRLHPGDTVTVHWTTATGQATSASVRLASGPVG